MKSSTRKRIHIPRDFIEALCKHVDGFSSASAVEQWGLARMVWEGSQKRRRHRIRPDAMTFSAEELDEHFGRGNYTELDSRVSLFRRSAGWSKNDGVTRAYWFKPQARKALSAYRAVSAKEAVDLLGLKGGRMMVIKSLPSAISSITTTGKTCSTLDWDFAKETLKTVPINVEMLTKLLQWLQSEIDAPSVEGALKVYLATYADIVIKATLIKSTGSSVDAL